MSKSIISHYIELLAENSSKDKSYIYRGQSENYDGDIVSTAKRRFEKSGDQNLTKNQYFEYHADLIKDAKSYRYGKELELNDTELLIDLQHYGAATGLIDFSEDFLVALWFACDNADEDGKVFFLDVWTNQFTHLDTGDDLFEQKDNAECLYYLHTNFKSNERIFAQKGVFIFGHKDIGEVKSITIEKKHKNGILQELKQYFGIEEKMLFRDIYGFAQVNNPEHKIAIKTANDYFQEAYKKHNSGQYQESIDLYKKAIEINPDMHEAYYNMGNAYRELKQYDKAIEMYKKTIEIKSDKHEAYNNMGIAYEKLKQYDKAIESYNKAIKIKPDYNDAYYNMGVAYKDLGEYHNAIEMYKKAIEINPDMYSAYYNMGIAYNELNQYDNAIESYNKAIEINPDYNEAYCNMGNAYKNLEQYQNAIKAYNKTIEINPDMHEAYYNMGNAYNELKQYDKAIEMYNKALVINPDMYEAYFSMGNAHRILEQYQNAIESYNKAIKINPDYIEAYFNMGVAYNELKQYDNSIESYKKAIDINPALIDLTKQQNWEDFEKWIDTLEDSPKKQTNRTIVNQLKGDG